MRYYEDLEVGVTEVGTETYLMTDENIMAMGREWDPQPFHTDPDAAAASIFGGLVASTVHLFGICVKIGMSEDPLAAVSNLGMKSINHTPGRPGDTLHLEQSVLDKRLSNSRPGMGIVSFRSTLVNQRGEPVFSNEPTVLVQCRPA